MSLAITEPKRNSSTYKESDELRQMRRRARQVGRSPEAKVLWKQVWKQKKKEREEWEKGTLAKVLKGDWGALQASKRPAITRQWTGCLLQDGNWKQNVKNHFESIFAKDQKEQVATALEDKWEDQQRKCKHVPWEPFTGRNHGGDGEMEARESNRAGRN